MNTEQALVWISIALVWISITLILNERQFAIIQYHISGNFDIVKLYPDLEHLDLMNCPRL